MSLSLSTLLLFILISPGFVLKFFINHSSVVRRVRIAPDPLYSAILLLIHSLSVHIVAITLAWIAYRIWWYFRQSLDIQMSYFRDEFLISIDGIRQPFNSFAVDHFFIPILYLVYCVLIVGLIVWLLTLLSKRFASVARFMYAPLSEFVMKSPDFLTAFVLTNIDHNGRRLVYSGYAREVGVRDGSKIDYVILETPAKFYLSLRGVEPRTTFANARQMNGTLFVDCDKIDNVHFQGWTLSYPP